MFQLFFFFFGSLFYVLRRKVEGFLFCFDPKNTLSLFRPNGLGNWENLGKGFYESGPMDIILKL